MAIQAIKQPSTELQANKVTWGNQKVSKGGKDGIEATAKQATMHSSTTSNVALGGKMDSPTKKSWTKNARKSKDGADKQPTGVSHSVKITS